MLGNNQIKNFSYDFISKLYENYTNPDVLANLQENDPEFFTKLAKEWPFFMKN